MPYEFKRTDLAFVPGSPAEKIVYDRYSTPEHRWERINPGDIVVVKLERNKDVRKVGELIEKKGNSGIVRLREINVQTGILEYDEQEFPADQITKPLDLKPSDFWTRWAKAGASVEEARKRDFFEDKFREHLFDGYQYSPGGRIQLSAGQEFVTGEKADLTAYNCYVGASPEIDKTTFHKAAIEANHARQVFRAVARNLTRQAEIMARGGGYGINYSTVPGSILTPGLKKENVILFLDKNHPDHEYLLDLILLGKFNNVTVLTDRDDIPIDAIIYDVEDSREGILKRLENLVNYAFEFARYPAVFDFTRLREKGSYVAGVNGRSSGAPTWMALFDTMAYLLGRGSEDNPGYTDAVEMMELPSDLTGLIEQGGSRRGALMLMLDIRHPIVRKFIHRKNTPGKIQHANVSVCIDNAFMKDVFNGHKESVQLWDEIIKSAWKSAEPGVVWMEFYNDESNSWYYAPIIATNPCGEQGLPAWAVCNLGHIRLPAFVRPDYRIGIDDPLTGVDWEALEKTIRYAVRFQDNIIDYTPYHLEENAEQQLSERRVGMGTMGLATMLLKLGLKYGRESVDFIDTLYRFIAIEAYKASIDLAEEKGKFPKCEPKMMAKSGFMKRMLKELENEPTISVEGPSNYAEKFFKYGTRNVTLLTQAPTGSTATYIDLLLQEYDPEDGASTGIEPYFAFEFYRSSRAGKMKQYVKIAQVAADRNGGVLPDYFVTAQDLDPEDHVAVQAAVQKWTDSSISKTANVPHDYTVEQTRKLYELAYKLGCKGVTIYRDGSRDAQVLSTKEDGAKLEIDIEAEKLEKLKAERKSESKEPNATIRNRPNRLIGFTEKVKYVHGDEAREAYVTVNLDEKGLPLEVFITATTPEDMPLADALGRFVAIYLQDSADERRIEKAIKHLKKGQTMMSLPAIVGRLMDHAVSGKIEFPGIPKPDAQFVKATCPECGSTNYDKVNCICHDCHSSKCN